MRPEFLREIQAGLEMKRVVRRRGFTLTEILLAISVAAIGLVTLGSLAAVVWRASSYAKYLAYASNLARQPLERIRGDQHYYRELVKPASPLRSFAEDFEVEQGKMVRFTGQIETTQLPPPHGRYVRIVSRVRWTQQGHNRETVLETIHPAPQDP